MNGVLRLLSLLITFISYPSKALPGIPYGTNLDHSSRVKIARVVQQSRSRSRFLFLYLDALVRKRRAFNCSTFADTLVELYAEHAPAKLIDFLRASSYYSLEAVSRKSFVTFLIT